MVRSLDRQASQRASQPRPTSIPTSATTQTPSSSAAPLGTSSPLRRSSRTATRESARIVRTAQRAPPPPRGSRPRTIQRSWATGQEGQTGSDISSSSGQRQRVSMPPVSQGSSNLSSTTSGPSSSTGSPLRRRVGALTLPQRQDTNWSNYALSSTGFSGSSAQASTDGPTSHSAALSSLHNFFNRELYGRTHESASSRHDHRNLGKSTKLFRPTEVLSVAFHHSEEARCKVNMFEKLPTEILCTILEYVVEPRENKPAASDDGDGPKAGNPLQYWYLDKDRSLLRLVCRSWNQTILAMAREINVTLGSDESMNALLRSVAERKSHGTSSHLPSTQRSGNHTGNGSNMSASTAGLRAASRSTRMLRRSPRLLVSSGSLSSSSMPVPRSSSEWDWPFRHSTTTGSSKVLVFDIQSICRVAR